MSSLNALMIAIEMAVRKRDDARQALRERQHAFDAAKSQMEQLENYAAEMQQRWGATEGASLKPEVMVHHRQFMERLEHAINLQTRVIADQSIRLNKVVETRRRDMELAQMRREQKQTDERAALQFIGRTFGMQFQEA